MTPIRHLHPAAPPHPLSQVPYYFRSMLCYNCHEETRLRADIYAHRFHTIKDYSTEKKEVSWYCFPNRKIIQLLKPFIGLHTVSLHILHAFFFKFVDVQNERKEIQQVSNGNRVAPLIKFCKVQNMEL